jgi:hypothetical protein
MVTLHYRWPQQLFDSADDGEFAAFTVAADGTVEGLTADLERYGFGGMHDEGLRMAGQDFREPYFNGDEPLELRIGDYVVAISQRGFKLEGRDEHLMIFNRDDDECLAACTRGRWAPISTDGQTFAEEIVICPVEFSFPFRESPLGPRFRLSALAV